MKHVPKPAIPAGTRVRFTIDGLGASKEDELHRITGEHYGKGDQGTVSFIHPNRQLLAWFYVEVESKEEPGSKRYVGVTKNMCEVVE